MSDKEDSMDASDSHDMKNGRTSLLDSGEDFEVLDEEDIDDDPPPLEDAGGGKGKNTDENKNTDPVDPEQEWLDVLGMWHIAEMQVYNLIIGDRKVLWSNPHTEMTYVCVLGNDLLKKKVLEAGAGRDSRPQKGQNVKINLKTYLKDGTPAAEEPNISFTLGDGDVIQVKWTVWDTV